MSPTVLAAVFGVCCLDVVFVPEEWNYFLHTYRIIHKIFARSSDYWLHSELVRDDFLQTF